MFPDMPRVRQRQLLEASARSRGNNRGQRGRRARLPWARIRRRPPRCSLAQRHLHCPALSYAIRMSSYWARGIRRKDSKTIGRQFNWEPSIEVGVFKCHINAVDRMTSTVILVLSPHEPHSSRLLVKLFTKLTTIPTAIPHHFIGIGKGEIRYLLSRMSLRARYGPYRKRYKNVFTVVMYFDNGDWWPLGGTTFAGASTASFAR